MSPSNASNLRVFIHWHDQTVFSGEEIKCTITFKNVASSATSRQQGSQQGGKEGGASNGQRAAAGRARATAGLTPPISGANRGHRRSALSLSIPTSNSRARSDSFQWPSSAGTHENSHSHKRSISIVSINSASTVDDTSHQQRTQLASRQTQRPTGHGRASSLQIVPRTPTTPSGPRSARYPQRQSSSPLFTASYPPDRFGRAGAGSPNGSSSVNSGNARHSPRTPPRPMPEFRFPATTASQEAPEPPEGSNPHSDDRHLSPRVGGPEHGSLAHRAKEQPADRPATRILANTSLTSGGTPRSSGEFYPMSNHSSETLASEYPPQTSRGHVRPPHLRRSSGLSPLQSKVPELIMMGYAQIQGSFILDGSLVSLAPFEQVKKSAVVGGRGGGVVGIDAARKDAGFMKGFGWGSISSSINDLLGGNDLSTIKEMRGVANSKSIPLLSTPQSILFVDMQLAPGESRSYSYTFKLPRGLPPTHKGKAMKIAYSLVIGTQRAGGSKEQQVRSVEVPFKVLGSVNSMGEVLGHDLMSPYVLLRDDATVRSVGGKIQHRRKGTQTASTLNEFLSYVDALANRPRNEATGTLLSPNEAPKSRHASIVDDNTSAREAIHMAILRSNMAADGQQSPNRFEIARNGQNVGVVMLTRPTYRLGEVVTVAVDFTEAGIPCFAIHLSLETTERVDSSLALRSESSIARVTRKVHASSSEAALYSQRVVFTPAIPITATPEFVTSGVSLEWKLRVEFVVPARSGGDADASTNDGEQMTVAASHPLLEKISQDEKGGLVLAAVENVVCESFDVSVPLRVYGAVGTGLERLERDEAAEEGLAI